jgi:hypothetical protein
MRQCSRRGQRQTGLASLSSHHHDPPVVRSHLQGSTTQQQQKPPPPCIGKAGQATDKARRRAAQTSSQQHIGSAMKRHAGPTATDNAASPARLATSLGSVVGLGAASALVLLVLRLAASVVDQGTRDQGSFGVVALRRVQLQPQQQQEGAASDWELPDEASREECNCFRHSDSGACCQRAVIRNHKFGWLLTERLFKPFSGRVNRGAIHPGAFPQHHPDQDYRHVAVVRNFSEAMVSGFLCHLSGRECWRTFAGGYREGRKQP